MSQATPASTAPIGAAPLLAEASKGGLTRTLRLWWALATCLPLLVASLALSALVPPLQSPDEFDHLKRAWLLTQGVFVLEQPQGLSSGGPVDTGLLAFMDEYNAHVGRPIGRVDAAMQTRIAAIRWSGKEQFSQAPGTGYHFPLIYAPQALALAAGKALDLSIAHSYQLARVASLGFSMACLVLASTLMPLSPLILGLIAVPMMLFQFGSASIDGPSTALAILAIALYFRLAGAGTANHPGQRRRITIETAALAGIVLLLVTCRHHVIALMLLPFSVALLQRTRFAWAVAVAVLLLTFAWMLVALSATVDARVPLGATRGEVVRYYLGQPLAFVQVLSNTIGDAPTRQGYFRSFLGILGWLDTPLPPFVYRLIWILLAAIALLSLAWPFGSVGRGYDRIARAVLAVAAGLSAIAIFAALLITWNEHPATLIRGVQGRYFMIPAILLASAVCAPIEVGNLLRRQRVALGLVIGLVLVSTYFTSRTLLARYWMLAG